MHKPVLMSVHEGLRCDWYRIERKFHWNLTGNYYPTWQHILNHSFLETSSGSV